MRADVRRIRGLRLLEAEVTDRQLFIYVKRGCISLVIHPRFWVLGRCGGGLSYEEELAVFGEGPDLVVHHELEGVDMLAYLFHEGPYVVVVCDGFLALALFAVGYVAGGYHVVYCRADGGHVFGKFLDGGHVEC